VFCLAAKENLFPNKRFRYMIAKIFPLSECFKMKIVFLTAAAVFFLASNVFSQTARPTAAPTPPADEDVVKISTALIQVDVTVTDKNGKIVSDLKPQEIEIYENGKRQEISNFSFVSNVREKSETASAVGNDKAAVPAPPVTVRPEQVRRTIALVVDDLTLSFESTHFVRRALKKFVDEQMQPGDLVAIIRTGGGIGALQQFTTDRRQLYAAIEKVRWNPQGAGKIGAFAPLESLPPPNPALSEEEQREETERDQARETELNDYRQSLFATGTLGAINYIVRGMQELPGRKSVMLMSDGFKLFTKSEDGFMDSTRIMESLRRLVDLANRASVVVYTMDARGLQTLGLTAADDTGGRSADQIEQAMSDRRAELFDTQDGLVYLARQTGGLAVLNNNDLSGGIRRMLDDQSYYLIGYQPNDDTFDPKTRRFNKLEIKVTRPGVKVRYRSGFFGVSDEQTEKPNNNLTPAQQIANALVSPFAVNGINLRFNALFGNSTTQGSFVTSLLHVRAEDFKFTDEANGDKKAVFDVLAMSFGENGVPVEQIAKTYTLTLKPEAFQKISRDGFVYHFTFPVKKPGAYQFRVAIRDSGSGRTGSANQFVEVPNLKKERLTLSSIILENMTPAQWERKLGNEEVKQNASSENQAIDETDPMTDTSLRRFKSGTILRFAYEIYNAKTSAAQKPNLTTQIRVFRDGALVLDGKQIPFDLAGQNDMQRLKAIGAISLNKQMQTGEYVLQIIVTDNLAKEKRKIATQFVQFEIVE
jgi:VWFA-related protein